MSVIDTAGGLSSLAMGMAGLQRPDPSQLAGNLISKIDTTGKGYIDKTDFQNLLEQFSASKVSDSADDLFTSLDGNSDGKITETELSDSFQQLGASLGAQFQSILGVPPPPAPGGGAGFTKDELTDQLAQLGSSDSSRSDLLSNLIDNFDQADTDGDSRISFKEAMAFTEDNQTASTSADSESDTVDSKVMAQILELASTYASTEAADLASKVSVTA